MGFASRAAPETLYSRVGFTFFHLVAYAMSQTLNWLVPELSIALRHVACGPSSFNTFSTRFGFWTLFSRRHGFPFPRYRCGSPQFC